MCGWKVALTSLICPVVQKYQRLCLRGSLLAASPALSLAELRMCPSSAEEAPERFCHRRPHQQNQNMSTSCISSCSKCPSVFQGPCPEQETSKSLPGTLLPRSPACSQPGKTIKQEEQTDLSRKLKEKAAAIWSWRKQEHNPLASIPCCFPLLPRVPPAPNAWALHRADLLVFSGLQPHPWHLQLWSIHQRGSCPSQQRAREITSLWGNQQLSGDRPCLPASCWVLSLSPEPVSSHPLFSRPYLVLPKAS